MQNALGTPWQCEAKTQAQVFLPIAQVFNFYNTILQSDFILIWDWIQPFHHKPTKPNPDLLPPTYTYKQNTPTC
jgi:hypothetical protein